MKFSWNLVGQVAATSIQAINQFAPFLPPKYQPWLTFGLATLQGLAGLAAHFYTPNGNVVPPNA